MRIKNINLAVNSSIIAVIAIKIQCAIAQSQSAVEITNDILDFDPSLVAISNDHQSVYCPQPYLERWRIVTDLNGDGKDDLILSDTKDMFGNACGGWSVYISSNGYWRCIGDVGLHPGGFTFDQVHNEVDLWYYIRSSAQMGYLGYYSFSPNGMKKGDNKIFIRANGDDENVFDRMNKAIFEYSYKHPYRLESSETSTNGVVLWKTMQDWKKMTPKNEILELKKKLAEAEKRVQITEEKLKQVSHKLDFYESDLFDVGGVVLGEKWKDGDKTLIEREVFPGFSNMIVRVDKNGYVDGIRLARTNPAGGNEIVGGRFPTDEEQKIIHQVENRFNIRFSLDAKPGTYIWENPFARLRVRINFRDKSESIIEVDNLKNQTSKK
jgi:hypothetical protein